MDSSVVKANTKMFLKKQHENGSIPPGFNEVCQFQEVDIGSTQVIMTTVVLML